MYDITTDVLPRTLRAKFGRLAQHVVPDLDQLVYARNRRSQRASLVRGPNYDALHIAVKRLPRHPDRSPHVVVVPTEGDLSGNWKPGIRNFYFEAFQVLNEISSPDAVSVFFVEPGEQHAAWQARLADYLSDSQATHLLTHVEYDPESNGDAWTWDLFWESVAPHWDGVFLGSMFDSSYRFTEVKAKIMAKISPSFVLVDICMPMNGKMHRARPEVGPVNMPMSDVSLELLDSRIANVDTEWDVAFFGVLYDYRSSMIRELEDRGLGVAINPHRNDQASTGSTTRANQPSWLDYMAGIAASKMTLNFSKSNAGPFEQLKTRVLEVGLAGSLLLTDDHNRTRQFWDPSTFRHFDSVEEIPSLVQVTLENESGRRFDAREFGRQARLLAKHQYWNAIQKVLQERQLPDLGIDEALDY